METRAGDPGAFAQFDLSRVDSPAFVVDAARLRANLAVLADIRDRAGVKVLAALKAFSMWKVAPIVSEYLDGVCTSGLWEARLAEGYYRGEIATYCAAYKAEDLPEICRISDHVIFNSPAQIARFRDVLAATGESFDVGLRINPLHAEGEVPRYDPCAPHSRLGFPIDQLTTEHMAMIDGIHMHTLCEQDFEPLHRTWDVVFDKLEPFFGEFLFTNVDVEGLMQGIDRDAVAAVRHATTRAVTAAGGVTTQDEVDWLASIGVDAVAGMAIYTGRLKI